MCELLVGKNIEEANNIIEQYNNMIYERPFDEETLDEANAFVNTSKQASRIRCATIGYRGMEQLLKDYKL
jgi:nitrogen fixation NifU-like protein